MFCAATDGACAATDVDLGRGLICACSDAGTLAFRGSASFWLLLVKAARWTTESSVFLPLINRATATCCTWYNVGGGSCLFGLNSNTLQSTLTHDTNKSWVNFGLVFGNIDVVNGFQFLLVLTHGIAGGLATGNELFSSNTTHLT